MERIPGISALCSPPPRRSAPAGCPAAPALLSPRSPHVAPQRGEEGLRLARAVEVEVDHDVVRIVAGSEDPVAAHTRPLSADRIALEGLLPASKSRIWCSMRRACILPPLLGAKPSVWGPAASSPERPAGGRVSRPRTLGMRPQSSPCRAVPLVEGFVTVLDRQRRRGRSVRAGGWS